MKQMVLASAVWWVNYLLLECVEPINKQPINGHYEWPLMGREILLWVMGAV